MGLFRYVAAALRRLFGVQPAAPPETPETSARGGDELTELPLRPAAKPTGAADRAQARALFDAAENTGDELTELPPPGAGRPGS